MLNESFVLLNEIRQNQDNNNRCFECNLISPSFISANYGIFICYVCATFHLKYLNTNLSNVIEIKPQNTEEIVKYINFMFCGGNKKLKEFMQCYDLMQTNYENIFESKDFLKKYQTKAAQLYREKLIYEACGLDYTSFKELTFEEGRENIKIIDEIKNNMIKKEEIITKDKI